MAVDPCRLLKPAAGQELHHPCIHPSIPQLQAPLNGQARPQSMPAASLSLDGEPLKGLVRIHDIPAQRGFGEEAPSDEDEDAPAGSAGSRLSDQLRSYYSKHLDPTKYRMSRIWERCRQSKRRRTHSIKSLRRALKRRSARSRAWAIPASPTLKPKVSTRLKAIDGLNHSSAVTFVVDDAS